MKNFTTHYVSLQSNEVFIAGIGLGFLLCSAIFFIAGYFYNRKLLSDKKYLTSEITQGKAANVLAKQKQQENQEQLEEQVQERTLELNIALQELEEINKELEKKNTIDELTGLFNRRFYDQKIIAEYRRSKRNWTALSLVLIDIDHFKTVNDTYGHLTGDKCLSWVSEQIKGNVKRSADMAFRYGGEEFCLILPDTDNEGAIVLAEALREAIASCIYVFKDVEIPLTISCGISTYQQQEGMSPEQLFAAADKALYQAKHHGRNQTQVCKEILE
ncbi:MAG: GGDEF domain-containing protein [Litorilituus sp.]|nr:GGDEF domain-containing protein [Litorilituus sp.]